MPMPAGANLLKLHLRMIPALPMQYEAYCLAFTRGDDFFQSDTKEAFLVLRRTLRIVPESGEIPRERQQPFLGIGECVLSALLQCDEFGFRLRLLVRAWFQRRSSSAATSRFAGATASYWRRARVTS